MKNFRTSSPGSSISNNPERTVPRRGGEPDYIEVVQQRTGSLNVKRLFLMKGKPDISIEGIYHFSLYVCVLCHIWLFMTLWTVVFQAPLSMKFSRQEYWSGLPFPTPGHLPDPGIKPTSLVLSAMAGGWVLYHCDAWEAPLQNMLWARCGPVSGCSLPAGGMEDHEWRLPATTTSPSKLKTAGVFCL